MTLLAGTVDGVWRLAEGASRGDRTLAAGAGPVRVWRVVVADGVAYAATDAGLFRSTDEGGSWTNLDVPVDPVYAVAVDPRDGVYAGTHPPRVYVSASPPGGWSERESLQALPSRSSWDSPVHAEGQVRHLAVPDDRPTRLVVGVERGGVHVSDDRGASWTERRDGVYDDVHHLHVVDAATYYAATGRGLYRTDDAGRAWTRLDGDLDRSYFRESVVHDGTVYAAATPGPSTTWRGPSGAEGALFESDDRGASFTRVPYPGEGTEAVLAWAVDDRVLAGTDRGRVLERGVDAWRERARIPAGVRSLAVL